MRSVSLLTAPVRTMNASRARKQLPEIGGRAAGEARRELAEQGGEPLQREQQALLLRAALAARGVQLPPGVAVLVEHLAAQPCFVPDRELWLQVRWRQECTLLTQWACTRDSACQSAAIGCPLAAENTCKNMCRAQALTSQLCA